MKEAPQQPMRVIGAGFGRTGTSSLKRALEMLGFGPCHHMEEVFTHPGEVPTWERAARGEKIDWVAFMAPWGSACDFPSSLYHRELMEAFPEAKVVLTVRDAGSWYASMSETLIPMMYGFPNRIVTPWLPFIGGAPRVMAESWVRKSIFNHFADRERTMRAFDAHTEAVKLAVPADRLLVFEVKQGWEPLCAFLGAAVPSTPFPRVNDTAEFKKRVMGATIISWIGLLFPIGIVLAVISWLLR